MFISVAYEPSEDKAVFWFPYNPEDPISVWEWQEQPLVCGFVGNKLVHVEPCACDWSFEQHKDSLR